MIGLLRKQQLRALELTLDERLALISHNNDKINKPMEGIRLLFKL